MPADEKVTVESAVRAAAAEHNIELTEEKDEQVESQNVEEKETSETKPEEPESSESIQLDARTLKALQILDQLEDAQNGPELVKAMAKQLGIIQDAPSQKIADKAAKTLREKVQATLGEDYPMLADKVGSLLEDLLTEQANHFNNEIVARDKARYEADIDARVVKFIGENKVTEAEQAEITKLSEKFPPSPKVPPEEYLAYHLKHIRAEQAEIKAKAKTNDKIKANLAESPANRGVSANEEQIVKAPKVMTPLMAVQMAVRGESVSD